MNRSIKGDEKNPGVVGCFFPSILLPSAFILFLC
jgi:hypothetical protein